MTLKHKSQTDMGLALFQHDFKSGESYPFPGLI